MSKIVDAVVGIFSKASDNSKEIGGSGFTQYGGYITPNERDRRLVGRNKYRIYGDMLVNTTIVASGVRYYLNLVSGVPWKVKPADESQKAKDVAKIINDTLNNMDQSLTSVIRRAAMYRYHGFSIQEWTAKHNDDGSIGLKSVKARPQITIERWDTDKHGNVDGVYQRIPQDGSEVYLPRGKIIYLVDDALDDTPEGLGILRHITERSTALNRLEQLEMYGFESDLRGVPIARIPYAEIAADPNLSDEDKKKLVEQMEGVIKQHIKADPNMGITMDSAAYESRTDAGETVSSVPKWEFKLLEGSSQGLEEVATAIDRINHEIARVLGVEHLLLGQRSGSRSLSEDKSNNFAQIVNGSLVEIAHAFQRDLIDPLVALNGWNKSLTPKFEPEKLRGNDVEKIGSLLRDLSLAGSPLSPDDPAIDDVRAMVGLSEHKPMSESDLMIPQGDDINADEEMV